MSYWTRDYCTGVTICAVCGKPKENKSKCCFTAPHIGFDEFCRTYFAGEEKLNRLVALEFWQDYLTSNCRSLKQYQEETTETVCA